MTREILFRGKSLADGEWVYGDLEHPCSDNYMVITHVFRIPVNPNEPTKCRPIRTHHAVDPNTVGQYTGLTDMDGNKIFEDDILINGSKRITYTVVWRDCGFEAKQNGSISYIGLEFWKDSLMVIGNIHDYPELMKGGGK